MSIKPVVVFGLWKPDEVAECMDGVKDELYQKLWSLVPHYKGKRPEEAEEPTPGVDSVASFWDRLTDEEKQELNRLANEWGAKHG